MITMQLKKGKTDKRLDSIFCIIVIVFCVIYGLLSTPVVGASMRVVVQNAIRPIAVYMIDIQTDRVVSASMITGKSGAFERGSLPLAEYAVVFRVALDPQFPLDYVEAVVPSVAIVQDMDFGAVSLTFSNDYTVFSGIVDAYLGLTDLDNLDNVGRTDAFNDAVYVEDWPPQRDVNSVNSNTNSGTPYGAGGIW